MILKGAQRGNAGQLARHLLNQNDNDFVEVLEVSGFISDDVTGAFKEIQAIAKGTKCTQPFFSVSISPLADQNTPIEMFGDAANRIAEANGLSGQPRVMVLHEKENRRHIHVVWSRIDATTMTAKNLPHFKNKLQEVSRELHLDYQLKLPDGLRDRRLKSPTNVNLAEWQAAKRRGKNAIDQRSLIRQCWASGDNKISFEAALAEHGYLIARGDRRNSHVIVCHDGEVLAVSRATGQRAKAVRKRLGETDKFPSVGEAMSQHTQDVRRQFGRMAGEVRNELSRNRAALNEQRKCLIHKQRAERAILDESHSTRWALETAKRSAQFKSGLSGLWQRLLGQRKKIENRNAKEIEDALNRDRAQRQQLINTQIGKRKPIDARRTKLRQEAFGLIQEMRSDRDLLIVRLTESQQKTTKVKDTRHHPKHNQVQSFDLEP